MEKPNTQTQATLQVLKNFRQQQRNPDTQSVFSLLEAQLETVPEPEKLQILNMLESLGKSAAEDLRCLNFKNVRDESDELGISGCPLKPKIESPKYNFEDLFGYEKEALMEDDSHEQFGLLLIQCQNALRTLSSQEPTVEGVTYLVQLEDMLMVLLRRYKSLCGLGLALPALDEERWHQDVHALFKDTFDLIGRLNQNEGAALSKMLTFAWVWEKGPPVCILSSSSAALEGLTIRVYGASVTRPAALQATVEVRHEEVRRDSDQVVDSQLKHLSEDEWSEGGGGIVLRLPKLDLTNLQGSRKNHKKGLDCKLYRVACDITLPLASSNFPAQFQCVSCPFTVRTGSPQLWAYTSTIVWFVWFQRDMREPDSKCPPSSGIGSILSLIQARIIGAGLRYSSLTSGERDGINPHRLTDGERQGWTDTIKTLCEVERDGSTISRSKFIRQMPKKECIWLLVCAAVNTGLRLMKYDLDRFYHIGLSNKMCRSCRDIQIGDFILRSSLTRIENSLSSQPHTKVIVQVCTDSEVEPVVTGVDDFDKWTLQEKVRNISVGKIENKCVYYILPSREDVRSIREQKRDTKKVKNSYSTKSNQEDLPPGLLIKGMSSLTLNDTALSNETLSESFASSPALTIRPEEEEEEPVRKKCAVSPETQHREEIRQTPLGHPGVDDTVTSSTGVVGEVTATFPVSPISVGAAERSFSETAERVLQGSPDNSSLGSHHDNEDWDSERLLSPKDEAFILKEMERDNLPPHVLNDVLLSSGSESSVQENPFDPVGELAAMSPESMHSAEMGSPFSDILM